MHYRGNAKPPKKPTALVPAADGGVTGWDGGTLPASVTTAGKSAAFAYAEFFGAELGNAHTQRAYRYAVDTFLAWCEENGYTLREISPPVVGTYLRRLPGSKPTQKLHLSAIRHFFDRLVVRHAVVLNRRPPSEVRNIPPPKARRRRSRWSRPAGC